MISLIFLLMAGSVLAYISQQNLERVSLTVGPYILANIPLFYVIIGSLVTGLIIAYLLNVIPSIIGYMELRGKDRTIKSKKHEVVDLTKRVHQLELENEKLRGQRNAVTTTQ